MTTLTYNAVHDGSRALDQTLYWLGFKIGAKLLLRRKLKPALKKLVQPLGYWRVPEYHFVFDEGRFSRSDTVLDIGSPKLFSLFLAKYIGATVYATDIDDYFIEEYGIIRQMEKVSPHALQLAAEDGRSLSYADGSFNKVYSISTIEHIAEHGDSLCVQEIARVLRPGGRAFITTPFAPVYRDEYKDEKEVYWADNTLKTSDGRVFYQRRYDEAALFTRLIIPSGLKLVKLVYIGERIMVHSEREFNDVLPKFSGPIQPLLSRLFHTHLEPCWQDLPKPLAAFMVLEKTSIPI